MGRIHVLSAAVFNPAGTVPMPEMNLGDAVRIEFDPSQRREGIGENQGRI